jgi:uncharacterized membrane protein YagU involved in acid resistance
MDTSHGTARFIGKGIIAGLIAGVVMAMYAMLASATFLHQGFFTPLYGIASPLIGPKAMMTSMTKGVYFAPGPAILGLMVHMLWSAGYGAVFGLLVRATHLSGPAALLGGLVYGVLVLLLMSFVVLPIVGAGAMPGTIGAPSFTAEHLLFGLVLGAWPLLRPQDFSLRHPSRTAAPRHA